MNHRATESLRRQLRAQRRRLLHGIANAEEGLAEFAEEQETELEERAQEDREARLLAQLDARSQRAVEEIDAALARLEEDTFGECIRCGEPIGEARLRAVPATPFCIDCAEHEDRRRTTQARVDESPEGASTTVSISDRDLTEAIRDDISRDTRVDAEELRVVCHHGVVYLYGALPSEGEHQIVSQIVTDTIGARELVDRIEVNELLWERSDRSRSESATEISTDATRSDSDNAFEVDELGLTFTPPDQPVAEEQ